MIPKSIANHEAVEKVNYAPDLGYEDYKYTVLLKDGWVFENSRNAGGQEHNIQTISDFKYAKPIKAELYCER